jgi:GAF domain-containing protein
MMPTTAERTGGTRTSSYEDLQRSLQGLLAGERDLLANTANLAALVFHSLPDLNWAGWYFLRGTQLVLGPFQGQPACVRIDLGRGVCGTAAVQRTSVLVPDVHAFPGHIACDAASRSELVVPALRADGTLLGVFDLDSPLPARFTAADRLGIEAAVRTLVAASDCDQARAVK